MPNPHTPAPSVESYDVVFSQLTAFSWRDIEVPTTEFTLHLRHDLAQHKYPDKDGANVEATGLAPIEIRARIPFRNGVVPARTEHWGVLYPTTFRAFLDAMADRTTGILNHPEMGQITCKPVSCDTAWRAEPRDGVDVDASWIQTVIPYDTALSALSDKTPVLTASLGALDLDANIGNLGPVLPQTPTFTPNFATLLRQIQSIGDNVSVAKYRLGGQIDALIYRANAVENALAGGDVTNWPAIEAAERVKEGLNGLKKTLLQRNKRPIAKYVTKADQTLAGVAATLQADVNDLIDLNPDLLRLPVVLRNSTVRYYAAA